MPPCSWLLQTQGRHGTCGWRRTTPPVSRGTQGVLKGYSRGTHGTCGWWRMMPPVSRGTQGVLKGYSRHVRVVADDAPRLALEVRVHLRVDAYVVLHHVPAWRGEARGKSVHGPEPTRVVWMPLSHWGAGRAGTPFLFFRFRLKCSFSWKHALTSYL